MGAAGEKRLRLSGSVPIRGDPFPLSFPRRNHALLHTHIFSGAANNHFIMGDGLIRIPFGGIAAWAAGMVASAIDPVLSNLNPEQKMGPGLGAWFSNFAPGSVPRRMIDPFLRSVKMDQEIFNREAQRALVSKDLIPVGEKLLEEFERAGIAGVYSQGVVARFDPMGQGAARLSLSFLQRRKGGGDALSVFAEIMVEQSDPGDLSLRAEVKRYHRALCSDEYLVASVPSVGELMSELKSHLERLG